MIGSTPVFVTNAFGFGVLYYYYGGKIYGRRTTTYCNTWLEDAFVVIDSSSNPSNDGLTATISKDENEVFIIQYIDTSGNIKVATSTANGLAPYTIL